MQVPGATLRRIPLDKPGAGIAVGRLHYSADPTMIGEKLENFRRSYSSDARFRREMEIEYEALEGELYFPEFNRERNVCSSFDVSDPTEWTIYQACDPHGRTPHAHVWEAISQAGYRLVVGELWPQTQYNTMEYAETVLWLESDSKDKPVPFEWCRGKALKIYRRIMDTHGEAVNDDEGRDYFEGYRKYKVVYAKAYKGQVRLDKARDEIGRLLLPIKTTIGERALMRPRMRVFEFCHETVNEFERVRYPEGEPERPIDERPKTYRRHCLDALHYIETARPRFVAPRRGGSGWEPIYEAIDH